MLSEQDIWKVAVKHNGISVRYGTKPVKVPEDGGRITEYDIYECIVGNQHAAIIVCEENSSKKIDSMVKATAKSISQRCYRITTINGLNEVFAKLLFDAKGCGY